MYTKKRNLFFGSIFLIAAVLIGCEQSEERPVDEFMSIETASIAGTIEPAISATVYAIQQNNDFENNRHMESSFQQEEFSPYLEEERPGSMEIIAAQTRTDPETGEFELTNLEPGTYKIEIEPHDPVYQATEIKDIELRENEEKDLGEIDLNNQEEETIEDEQEEYL